MLHISRTKSEQNTEPAVKKRNVAVKNSQAGLNKLLGQGPQAQSVQEVQSLDINEHLIIDDENDDLSSYVPTSEKPVTELPISNSKNQITPSAKLTTTSPSILANAVSTAITKQQQKPIVNGTHPAVQPQSIPSNAKVLAKALVSSLN